MRIALLNGLFNLGLSSLFFSLIFLGIAIKFFDSKLQVK